MIVELTLNWTYATTPSSPYPVTIYYRLVGTTVFSSVNVADASTGTATITLITTSTDGIDTSCNLEYEGYIIPDCFTGSLTDCDPADVSGCPISSRVYFTKSVDATDYQNCRGVEVTCTQGVVLSINIPTIYQLDTWASAPIVTITGGDGFDLAAEANWDSGTGLVSSISITNNGNGYSVAPTVTLSTSDQSHDISCDVTIGCNPFTYDDCTSTSVSSGNILVGEVKEVCLPATDLATFEPSATFSTFTTAETGCCNGTGLRKYTLDFKSPSNALYPDCLVSYVGAGGITRNITLATRAVTVCAVIDSFSSPYIADPVDAGNNAWLFENYVTITDLGAC